MEWQSQNNVYKTTFDIKKERWSTTANELGRPGFVLNDREGWRTVSIIPRDRVWSYVFDPHYLGDPKGPTGYLKFGIHRNAQHFLVFDLPWHGEVSDVVISYRRTCKQCSSRNQKFPLNDRQSENCQSCDGFHEWEYPLEKRAHHLPLRNMPESWQSLSPTFSTDVLRDPKTSGGTLVAAAQRGNMDDRIFVASHPKCPDFFLNENLASDPQFEVRRVVALRAHKGVNAEVVAALCRDESEEVRAVMACHRAEVVGTEAHVRFASDPSVLVRTKLALNFDVPNNIVLSLLAGSGSPECKSLREALAGHPAIDANANLVHLTRNFEDLFPTMFYELLARNDLSPETLSAIRSHISEEDFRLRGMVDDYGKREVRRRLLNSTIFDAPEVEPR
jgi:hypothetical protein